MLTATDVNIDNKKCKGGSFDALIDIKPSACHAGYSV